MVGSKFRVFSFEKDDRVLIVRPSTKEWIASVACTEYGGGSVHSVGNRVISTSGGIERLLE